MSTKNRETPSIISTGNEELDLKLSGGLPFPSLIIIEGGHGTSKSVLAQQFVYGMLKQGLRVTVFTTETTTKDYIMKMKRLNMDVTSFFLRGKLRVYSTQVLGVSWVRKVASRLLPLIGDWMLENSEHFEGLVIDSLSHLAIYATPAKVLEFFNKARVLTDKGRMITLTLHERVLREDLATRARALCDGYIRLKVASIGGKTVKVMEIVKLKGAPATFEQTITFDVDPAFGIKLVPIALAKA